MLLAEANPLSFSLLPFITSIVVALIFIAVLKVKVWPIITKGLDERNEKILSEIRAAEDARKEAKAAQASFEARLVEAQEEATKTIAAARADAQRIAGELRAKAESELADLKKRAHDDMDSARRQAVADLEAHAAHLAISVAGRILGREIRPSDQSSLIADSLKELAATRN
ncbi:MAG: F0F1 ATP synthase subunit B [Planctomycetota bacterium]|nr:F0F1 ATP synthase subunit B [Planctomycetota bacterium]MDA1105908.1 F0F1 ATP synthase subunit B [Planctomycetota bacterium]